MFVRTLILLSPFIFYNVTPVRAESARALANTMKVISFPCQTKTPRLEGTGSILVDAGRSYVLTSEHVVLHGNQPDVCHHVERDGKSFTAKLASVDWGVGLALMDVPQLPATSSALSLNDFSDDKHNVQASVELAGYSVGSNDLVLSPVGRILTLASDRHILPNVSKIIEVVGAHGEFGWSGTLAYNNEKPIGMLSHQYLSGMGRSRTVNEYRISNETPQNHLLLISASRIAEWLIAILPSEPAHNAVRTKASFVKDLNNQLQNKNAVVSAGIKFTEQLTNQYCANIANTAQQEVAASGGNDPTGAGGATMEHANSYISVGVDFGNGEFATHAGTRAQWLESLREPLFARQKLTIPLIVYRNPDNGTLHKLCSKNLAQFFSYLSRPNHRPVVIRDEGNASDFKPWTEPLNAWLGAHSNSSVYDRDALAEIRGLSALLASDGWMTLTRADFATILDQEQRFKNFWEGLYRENFDEAIALRRTIIELQRLHGGKVLDGQ